MWASNYTFAEIATEIEQYGTDREREIVRRVQEENDSLHEAAIISEQNEISLAIMENSIDVVNTELAKAVRDLVIDLVEAKGGKRKSRNVLNWFCNRFENCIGSDEAEMLAEFIDIVGKALD